MSFLLILLTYLFRLFQVPMASGAEKSDDAENSDGAEKTANDAEKTDRILHYDSDSDSRRSKDENIMEHLRFEGTSESNESKDSSGNDGVVRLSDKSVSTLLTKHSEEFLEI